MKLGIIIQARLSSTRLPNKIILPFYNNVSLINIIISNLKRRFPLIPLIVATTTNINDDILVKHIQSNVCVYRGSELDVLDRVIKTSEKYGFTHIIRICSDNPFLDLLSVETLIFKLTDYITSNTNIDYIGYSLGNGFPSIRSHIGIFSELVSLKALKTSYISKNINDFHKEHVTYFIHSNESIFDVHLIDYKCTKCLKHIRLTLDTPEDFKILSCIYKKLYLSNKDFDIIQIVNIINSNIYYKHIMASMILQYSK